MSRRTVDFGIDLGTTNSAIAVMDSQNSQARILENYQHSEITPSAVRIDETSSIIIGQSAYSRLYTDPANTCSGFKLLMGSRQIKSFLRSGKGLKPEELSAEIIKDLKATVRLRMPDEPNLTSAVITVPCYFEMTQSQATTKAAQLAGIDFSPLLQEPIAASIAYGFMEKMPKGYWVVYDLGGGTFDIALLSAQDGHLVVMDHGGDNFLGGNDFDWHIVEDIIYPALRETFDLPDLSRTPQYGLLNSLLKYAAEEAKIKLSESDKTEIVLEETESLKDQQGKAIHIRIPFNRAQLNCVIEEDVDKSFRIFRQVLKNQNLSSDDIGHLILVGGPTQIPFIRERIKQEFNIPVSDSVDPMTVVARGAAIYASTQLLPADKVKHNHTTVAVELKYEPMTMSLEASVGGRILAPDQKMLPERMMVQINSVAGDWQSGMIETKNQTFFLSVLLRENRMNHFKVSLFDHHGNHLPLASDSFVIHQGMSVGAPPLARSIGVELYDGSFDRLLTRGVSLPAKATYTYHVARELIPGQENTILEIPVREGESERFDQNRHLGSLVIRGTDIHRKIPVNADVEVTLFVDQSRSVSAQAFIPIVDQKFSMRIPNMTSPLPNLNDLSQICEREDQRWNILMEKARVLNVPFSEVVSIVNGYISEIRRELQAAIGGDQIAVEKVDRRIKDLQGHIDAAEKTMRWPGLLKEHQIVLEDTQDTLDSWSGSQGDYMNRFGFLKKDGEKAVTLKDAKRLEKVNDDLQDLKWEILFRQKDFWIGAFQELRQKTGDRFIDQSRAEDLIEEGARALARQDTESVQSITIELWKLISRDEQEDIKLAVNSRSGIKRKSS